MATLISLYKDNRITSSEVESKDIDIVLGFLFKNYVLGEDIYSDCCSWRESSD